MDSFKIATIGFFVLGIILGIISFRKFQTKDKRYKSGVKLKGGISSFLLLILAFICFFISYKLSLI